ncbi:MAG: prolipoprotein diacylglyceryl transferase [Lachnospiraceae bacterium]|nr:prolipoprotein diacylglyceryl transferase [Lachnospiraceae bacterium]
MGADSILFPNLHITLAHVGQGVQIGPLWIAFYGICIAAAMLAGINLAMYLAKKTGQDPDTYFNFAIVAVILSVLGARIYYVAFSWDYYGAHPARILDLRGGGLAIYGGVITGILCAVVYCRRKRLNLLLFLDTALPAVTLGQAIGRWGNFFNREVFGGYTDSLFAMALPKDILPVDEVTDVMLANPLVRDGVTFVQVHPTFLYESLWNFVLLIIMLVIIMEGRHGKSRKRFDGEIACLYLLGYGLGRFWIEGIRTDRLLIPGTALPVSQVISGILAAAGATVLIVGFCRSQRDDG